MNLSLTIALRRMVSRKIRIRITMTTDMIPSGNIMIPPLERISRKSVCSTAGALSAAVAAETSGADKAKTAAEKERQFMEVAAV